MPKPTALTLRLHAMQACHPQRAPVARALHPTASHGAVSVKAPPSPEPPVPRNSPALACIPLALAACTGGDRVEPPLAPPGAEETARTNALEAGAALLQDNGPLARMDMYVVGFHPMKDDPSHQMEAHHFCRQVNEDFAQCALFDGNGPDANLTGIEYIVSEALFDRLAPDEQAYWHPHNGEILSGQLVAPNLPDVAEKALMRSKMNSYGKTWHTWHTRHGTQPGDSMPEGPAMLAWSFNRDGEVLPGLVEARDRRMDVSTAERRSQRADLVSLARPQAGVDALRPRFPATKDIPGVVDRDASASPARANQAPPAVR